MSMVSVEGTNVSTAWLTAVRRLDHEPERKALHTVVRITDPTTESPAVREAVENLLKSRRLPSVETVANTIFPESLARTSRDHADLVARYEHLYPVLQRYPGNESGTYFGRLVMYPTAKEPFDQVGAVIKRIITQRDSGNPKHAARFETLLAVPDADTTAVPIYVPNTDNNPMRFPCLSHCLFQTDSHGNVHLLATYRYQYLVQKGYGNYLGLARLLSYVAQQTGSQVGHLTVVAGKAHLEPPIMPIRAMFTRFAGDLEDE
jgi:hypothetical protein